MSGINLFVPTFRVDETLNEIRECLEKGWTGFGFKTLDFENAWRAYTGLPHAHFVSSATAGLHLAIRLLKTQYDWSDGDEIITTPLTFVSSNHAILYERLTPVFADVDQYLCLDPESVESRITERTRAVLFVGLGGTTGQLPRIAEICRARGIRLILDAAHMAGTRWKDGRHVGAEGDATVFSYHAVKNLPTADSGMICLPAAELDARARTLSWMGITKDTFSRTSAPGSYKWQYDVVEVGFKYHGNSVMAAIALVALRYLDSDNAWRRQLAAWYTERLAGVAPVELIPMPEESESSRHLYQIRSARRDQLLTALEKAGIAAGVHYADNTHYRMYSHATGTCPNAAQASAQLLSLPMHMRLTREDVDRVCDVIAAF
ncbi:MAG TPA: DegT/DnrJ/EryC1/StrS family aminotransferase [Thermoanaerobaculia bacterium]|nr:DegT/DnrJ/EryC1/StrS family aminotransferase [Thermoanaerobaculia bacterium]